MNRREFLAASAVGSSGFTRSAARSAVQNERPRVGICDWNLGASCDPAMISRAAEAGLQGIQVSVGTAPDNMPLRDPKVLERYRELGDRHNTRFHSVAAGSILNQIPLKSEPQSAVYVIDAIETAKALGADNVLMAFFGNGDLRLRDSEGEFRMLTSGPFKTYELDATGVTRVVEVLRQIVPRAEKLEVILGLENTLTAEQNLEIIERVGSSLLQVYYDVGNSTHYGYDVASEIRRLGRHRICEIHLKDWATPILGAQGGEVDFFAAAEACRAIGYDKWFVLESSGRENKFLEDTRANVAFVKQVFA